jgi:hypothetical protein
MNLLKGNKKTAFFIYLFNLLWFSMLALLVVWFVKYL